MAVIQVTGSGNQQLKAGVAGKRIRVINYTILTDKATTVQFKSGTTNLTGTMSLALDGGISADVHPASQVFATLAGEALNMELGNIAANVAGHFEFLLN